MLITATSRVTTLGLALLFAIGMVSSGFASQGGLTTIDVPGASSTQAKGINPEGDIVGEYSNATGTHGFLLSKGNFTTIDVPGASRSEEHTSELQSRLHLVCRLLLEKKKKSLLSASTIPFTTLRASRFHSLHLT